MSDIDLITIIGQHRDERALECLIERYESYVRMVCARILYHSNHLLDDAVSIVWQRVWRYAARFRRACAVATWLRRIASSVAKNLIRFRVSRGSDLTSSLNAPIADDDNEMGQMIDGYDPNIIARDDLRRAFDAIAALPSHYAAAWWAWWELDSYEAVASRLGISMGTVKSRLHRAREIVKCAVFA